MISKKEIYYVQAFISSNLDSMYQRTNSLDSNKYFRLFKQIIRKRLETGFLTTTDFKNKTLKLKLKSLTLEQRNGLEWLDKNDNFLKERIISALKKRK